MKPRCQSASVPKGEMCKKSDAALWYTKEQMGSLLQRLNIMDECSRAHLAIWSCPPFLFLILGFLNISAMLASYFFASKIIDEPEEVSLIVILVSVILLVIGTFIIHGFDRIAEANRMKSEFVAIV